MLKGKKIILGVTGGIAAFKSVEIASRLKKAGAEVHVIMTQGALNFVTELTFREISGNPVNVSMWGEVAQWNVEHIALAKLADLVLIAPCTANLMAKAANGIADDMLTTVLLATKAPIMIAPAMNSDMYLNRLTQENMAKLASLGWKIIKPASGPLACGVNGVGRLPEPEELVQLVEEYFTEGQSMHGLKVLVTASGTYEPIDPVRYIGNRSSGKMGYAIAGAAKSRGADVLLVSGPSALKPPDNIKTVKIESAAAMREAVLAEYPAVDVVIMAAAVADYRVDNVSDQKIKKNDDELVLVLKKNPDILKELGEKKQPGQILVGFAAETRNILEYAQQKLEKKNLDMIIANDVSKPGAGFNTDTNIVKILSRNKNIEELPLMSKQRLADIILDRVMEVVPSCSHLRDTKK